MFIGIDLANLATASKKMIINTILVILYSFALGFGLDSAICTCITYHYRKKEPYALWDPPTFQKWKAPTHHCLLISIWVPTTLVVIIWRCAVNFASFTLFRFLVMLQVLPNHLVRFFSVSFQPREMRLMITWKHTNQDTRGEDGHWIEKKSQQLERYVTDKATQTNEIRWIEEKTQENKCQDTKENIQTEPDNVDGRLLQYQSLERNGRSDQKREAFSPTLFHRTKLPQIRSPENFDKIGDSTTWYRKILEVVERQSTPKASARAMSACSDPFISGQLPSQRYWRFNPSEYLAKALPTVEGNRSPPYTPTKHTSRHKGPNSPTLSSSTSDNKESPPSSPARRIFQCESLNAPQLSLSTSEENVRSLNNTTRQPRSISENCPTLSESPIKLCLEYLDKPSSENTRNDTESAADSPLEWKSSHSVASAVMSPYTAACRTQPVSPSTPISSRVMAPKSPHTLIINNNEESIGKDLRQEIESWGDLVPRHWEGYLKFDPLLEPSPQQLARERLALEEACAQKRVMEVRSFRVHGKPKTFDHDRLKCWVLLNRHLHEETWPKGYVPETSVEELRARKYQEEEEESNASFF